MKTILYKTIVLAALFAISINGHAKSWRVNSNTTRGAHFADINAAMNSTDVQDGDTLYLDPGCNLNTIQNVTKRVTIIGNGFFHDLHQPYGYATISGELYLKAPGCKIEGVNLNNYCYVAANNVTIERCKLTGYYGVLTNGNNCNYAAISNCYFYNYGTSIRGSGKTSNNSTNWIIRNNMINNTNNSYNDNTIEELNSAIITNNLIRRFINSAWAFAVKNLYNSIISNNIILSGALNSNFGDCTDCVINRNILSCAEGTYPSYPDNKCLNSIDLQTIFTMTGTNDQQFQLCEGSPAKGYATDGGDCGPYGSGYTYVPGGLPLGMPYYTEATIGSMAHDGKVKVSLKIAVQDE